MRRAIIWSAAFVGIMVATVGLRHVTKPIRDRFDKDAEEQLRQTAPEAYWHLHPDLRPPRFGPALRPVCVDGLYLLQAKGAVCIDRLLALKLALSRSRNQGPERPPRAN